MGDVESAINFDGYSDITYQYKTLDSPPSNLRDKIRDVFTRKEVEECFNTHLPEVAKATGYKNKVKRALQTMTVSYTECELPTPNVLSTFTTFFLPYIQFPVHDYLSDGTSRTLNEKELRFMPMAHAFSHVFNIPSSQFEVSVNPMQQENDVYGFTISFKAPMPNIKEVPLKLEHLVSVLNTENKNKCQILIAKAWRRYGFAKNLPKVMERVRNELSREFRIEDENSSTVECAICMEEKMYWFHCPRRHLVCGQCLILMGKDVACPFCRSTSMRVSVKLTEFLKKNIS